MKRKEKLLYTDKDTDFEPGETVTGRVADFEWTERGNLRYVYVDADDDLGREFYEKILSNKTYMVIDYDHPERNAWECEIECV